MGGDVGLGLGACADSVKFYTWVRRLFVFKGLVSVTAARISLMRHRSDRTECRGGCVGGVLPNPVAMPAVADELAGMDHRLHFSVSSLSSVITVCGVGHK